MSGTTGHPAARGRWIDWQPKGGILAEGAENEPTKPSEPGSVGFEGVTSADSPEIEAETEQARSARRLLNRAGVRIMILESGATIGVWSDLDGPEIRAALRTLGNADLPVRYLDGAGVPIHYKARRVAGEPVPLSVLSEMERNPADPWRVRDQMFNESRGGGQFASTTESPERNNTPCGRINRTRQNQQPNSHHNRPK